MVDTEFLHVQTRVSPQKEMCGPHLHFSLCPLYLLHALHQLVNRSHINYLLLTNYPERSRCGKIQHFWCWRPPWYTWNILNGEWFHTTLYTEVTSVSAIVRQWYLGGYRGDYKGPVGVPPLGVKEDHRDDVNTWGGWVVGIYPGGGGTGNRGTTPHKGVY